MKSTLLLSLLLPVVCLSADPPAASAPAASEKAAVTTFTLQVLAENKKPASREETNAAETNITVRLNKRLKVKFKSTVTGDGGILLEFPALTPKQVVLARRLMQKPGRFDVRTLGPDGLVPVGKDDAAIKPGFVKLPYLDTPRGEEEKAPAEEKYLWVNNRMSLPRGCVKAAGAYRGPGATNYHVELRLNADGGELMRKLSAAQLGKPLALIVDGEVISAPMVMAEFGQNFFISGSNDSEEAETLAIILQHPLESEVRIVEPDTPAPQQKDRARYPCCFAEHVACKHVALKPAGNSGEFLLAAGAGAR